MSFAPEPPEPDAAQDPAAPEPAPTLEPTPEPANGTSRVLALLELAKLRSSRGGEASPAAGPGSAGPRALVARLSRALLLGIRLAVVVVLGLAAVVWVQASNLPLAVSASVGPSQIAALGSAASPTASPADEASPARPTSAATTGPIGPVSEVEASLPLPTAVAPMASITFKDLVLDPAGTGATLRTFDFTSDGPGPVWVVVSAGSPDTSTTLCLSVDGSKPRCDAGAMPGFAWGASRTEHSSWTATLVSTGSEVSTVDLGCGWPSRQPSIDVRGALLAGLPNPDSARSLTATFVPRASGQLSLEASWGRAPLNASLTLTRVAPGAPVLLDRSTYDAATSISPAYLRSVVPTAAYQLTLMNESATSSSARLEATIAFP